MDGDVVKSNLLQQPDTFARSVDRGNRRRTSLETPGVRCRIESLHVKRKGIRLAKPSRDRGHERSCERLPHIEESQTRRPQQILQGSTDIEVEIHRLNIQ